MTTKHITTMVQIRITASNKKLGKTSRRVLTKAAEAVGLERIIVTSTQRQPRAQAEAMLTNIENNRNIRYKFPGEQVCDLARSMRRTHEAREDILDAMVAKIVEFNNFDPPQRVSKHCVDDAEYARHNVIDVSYDNMPEEKRIPFLRQMIAAPEVEKVLQPLTRNIIGFDMAEPSLHFEIKQA